MAKISTIVLHQVGQGEAINRLRKLINSLDSEYRDQVREIFGYQCNECFHVRFETYGFEFCWTARVHANRIELVAQVPQEALKFRGKIEETVKGKIAETLGQHHRLARAA